MEWAWPALRELAGGGGEHQSIFLLSSQRMCSYNQHTSRLPRWLVHAFSFRTFFFPRNKLSSQGNVFFASQYLFRGEALPSCPPIFPLDGPLEITQDCQTAITLALQGRDER